MKLEFLRNLLETKKFRELQNELLDMNEADIAEFMEESEIVDALTIFRLLPKLTAATVFSFLPIDFQEHIISSVSDEEVHNIMSSLFIDDTVDLVEELPANVVKRILKNVSPERRKIINEFLNYPEDSAGSIMTSEFVDVKNYMTVSDAINRLRTRGIDSETVYTLYCTDESRKLEGVVPVRSLLLAEDDTLVKDLMETNVISVHTTDDQEIVADMIKKYDFVALPVVDHEDRLVGIVTFDDAIDVMEEESEEDFEIMGGMHPSEKPYLKTSTFELAKNRIVWLLVLMISATITGNILGFYEAAFVQIPILVTFIPMLTDTGGNAGSQSSTIIIRGLATHELDTSDFFVVFWKELKVSFLVGLVLSAFNYFRLLLIVKNSTPTIAFVVSLAMLVTVMISKCIGGVLPLIAKKLKFDPAIMAAPLITTIVDAAALILYFEIAKIFLHL